MNGRLEEFDQRLLAALEPGLPLVSHPYATLAAKLGATETQVIERLADLKETGVISRFGVIVRHHELGICANAMVVWDLPDCRVEAIGQRLAALPFVTLCYRRPRRRPHWPYNLFCMIHGRDRDEVLRQVAQANAAADLAEVPQAVLFSKKRFKQRGARYGAAPGCGEAA